MTRPTMRLDWETRSEINIKVRGAYIYAMHPSTDALIASYQIDNGPIRRWRRGEPCPDDFRMIVEENGEITAFNAAFERLIWWYVMSDRHGWPKPRLEQFRCTAVTSAALSMPRDLDKLGAVLDLKVQKDKEGKKLMAIHSIPQGFDVNGHAIWHPLADDPASLERYHAYCDDDVRTEALAAERLIPLSDEEMEVYWLNERINDRGLRIDVRSARAAVELSAAAIKKINAELTKITDGEITAVTQTARFAPWLETRGVSLDTIDKDTVDEMLVEVDDLPDDVRRVLELRQEGAKPSVQKIDAMLNRVCSDGRARGVYLHHGAGQTGRFSSRGLQAHNMPKYRKEFESALEAGTLGLDLLMETIRSGDPNVVELVYGPKLGRPLHLLSDAVRSFIWAAPGHEFIDADYSSIEGRMAAWFAREQWKIEAFEALDRGEGFGIYELAAAGIYGIKVEDVTKLHRPVGKVSELSCQYQTGAGGIRKFARGAKIKLHTLYPTLWGTIDKDAQDYLDHRFQERVNAHDPNTTALGREGWIAAEMIKTGWRKKHPAISDREDGAWAKLEEAATLAVKHPGTRFSALFGKVRYLVAHGFLLCQLPSGRCLAYASPKIKETEAPWADKTLPPEQREKKMSLTVRGTDATQNGRWVRFSIYGGSLFNNVVQGSARDILVAGMKNAEAAGYPIVLHTHDEMAAEVPRGWGDVKEFERLICDLPPWTAGLPLTADGFRSKRYKK